MTDQPTDPESTIPIDDTDAFAQIRETQLAQSAEL